MVKIQSCLNGIELLDLIKVLSMGILTTEECLTLGQALLDHYCNLGYPGQAKQIIRTKLHAFTEQQHDVLFDECVLWISQSVMACKPPNNTALFLQFSDGVNITIGYDGDYHPRCPKDELVDTIRDDIEQGVHYPNHIRRLIERVIEHEQ